MTAITTRALVSDYVKYRLQLEHLDDQVTIEVTSPPSKAEETMRALGQELENTYNQSFTELCQQLHITPTTAHSTFAATADELFRDEGQPDTRIMSVKWGRVVALFVFCGCLAVQCVKKEMPSLVSSVIDWTVTYTENNLMSWIQQNNGWSGLVEFYENGSARRDSVWPSWKNIAIALSAIGVVTIGGILANK